MKRFLLTLILAAAIGGAAQPAHAIDTVPLPERPIYTKKTYAVRTYSLLLFRVQAFPGILY